jgi:hypothetical protein
MSALRGSHVRALKAAGLLDSNNSNDGAFSKWVHRLFGESDIRRDLVYCILLYILDGKAAVERRGGGAYNWTSVHERHRVQGYGSLRVRTIVILKI